MKPPTQEQAESLAQLFRSNNTHISNFKKWIEDSIEDNFRLMIDPSVPNERLLRMTGEANALVFLKQTIEKHTK